MNKIRIQRYHSPCGDLMLGSFEDKLCLCDWATEKHRDIVDIRLRKMLQTGYEESSSSVIEETRRQLDEYFEGTTAEHDGLPSVKYFADKLFLSPNYFGDMLKKETGKTPQEYIQEKVIEIAKDRISGTQDMVSQIAYSLGFQYPQHLCRLFKKRVGCTPNEYRTKMIG